VASGLRWRITPLVRAMATLTLAPVAAAAVSGHGALVGIAVPAAVWLVVAGSARRADDLRHEASADVDRCAEGAEFALHLSADVAGADVRARPVLDALTELVDADQDAGQWHWTIRTLHWGRTEPRFDVHALTHGGAWAAERTVRGPRVVIEPEVEVGGGAFRGSVSRPSYGDWAVRIAGAGAEFLEVRAWVPGQPLRRVHWPATMRTGQLHVAGMAATRNQDVLIVIDNAEGSRDVAAAVFDRSARAAVTLARQHLAVGDRVALAISSPDLFCQRLGSGRRHLIRVVDTIMDARRLPGFVKPRLDLLPRSVLTPGALVIVLSPLLGEDSIALIGSLRRRGHPTVVIDPLDRGPDVRGSALHRRAVRLWDLEREATRHELGQRGIVVLRWPPGVALAGLLKTMAARPIAPATPQAAGARR
jgi:uncharacterized protein (DUF58 family)